MSVKTSENVITPSAHSVGKKNQKMHVESVYVIGKAQILFHISEKYY